MTGVDEQFAVAFGDISPLLEENICTALTICVAPVGDVPTQPLTQGSPTQRLLLTNAGWY